MNCLGVFKKWVGRGMGWDMEMDREVLEVLFEYLVENEQLKSNEGIRNKFLLAINMLRHDRPDVDALKFINEVVAAGRRSVASMTPGLERMALVGIMNEVESCLQRYPVVAFNTSEVAYWSSLRVLLKNVGDALYHADYRDVSRPYIEFLRTMGHILAAV